MKRLPRYPVYIPTKGRAHAPFTIRMFERAGIPFHVVVEPSQVEAYTEWKNQLVVMPEDNKGLVYARNFIKDYSTARGEARHWQFDDDIRRMARLYHGHRLYCDAAPALVAAEDFVDRYENVALCSFNSIFFVTSSKGGSHQRWPPFYLNSRCYTCFLVLNALPNRWRYRYNEDTDMSLQVLSDGWCTILLNAFMIQTLATESNATGRKKATTGGGQAEVYAGDGRLKMARDLERVWPKVVTVRRRFGRPQHKVAGSWTKFDTPLIRRRDIDWEALPKVDEYGMYIDASPEHPIVQRVARRKQKLERGSE